MQSAESIVLLVRLLAVTFNFNHARKEGNLMETKVQPLTKSEEEMMDLFWSSESPLTSVDIVNMKVRETWGNGLVHNIIRSLVKKGVLVECGLEHYNTQYARKLMPAMTKEEYTAKLMLSKMGKNSSLSRLVVALAKERGDNGNLIDELEEIIQQLREEEK